MWQELLVFAMVGVAALYAVWRLMPGAWRERLGGKAGGCGSEDGCSKCSSKGQGGCH